MARVVTKLDREARVTVLPFEDEDAASLVAMIPTADLHESWQVISRGNRLQGGDAAMALMEHLSAARMLASVLRRFRCTGLVGVLYHVVSTRRHVFGRFVKDVAPPRRLAQISEEEKQRP